MDLKVYLPTVNVERFEKESLPEFLQVLEECTNRQNAFFDENVAGYVVLTNDDILSAEEQEIYFETLKKSFISVDLSVHPSKRLGHMGNENFQIKTFNYSYSDCIFNDVIKYTEEVEEVEENAVTEESEETDENVDKEANGDAPEKQESENVRFVAIWKLKLPISYPKRKINNPEIIISILLTLSNYQHIMKTQKLAEKYSKTSKVMIHDIGSTDELELRQAYKPIEDMNLLQGLEPQIKVDELQTEKAPTLSIGQITPAPAPSYTVNVLKDEQSGNKRSSIVSTNSVAEDGISPTINLNARILLPVYPVLNMRLKCTKPAGRNDILLTTLEIESSKELSKINMSLNLLEIKIEFPNGSIKPVIPEFLQKFPIEIKFNDNLNFVYELINNNSSENLTKKPMMISLISQPIAKNSQQKSYESSNKILTNWSTVVDFSIVAPPTNTALKSQNVNSQNSKLNTNFGVYTPGTSTNMPSNNGRQFKSNSILSSVSDNSSTQYTDDIENRSSVSGTDLDIHQKLKLQTRTASTSLTVNIPRTSKSVLNGLILSFHGTTNVKVGQIFKWKIQAINKAHKMLNLSLYIQPKENNNHSFLTTNMGKLTPKVPSFSQSNSNSHIDSSANRVKTGQIIYPYSNAQSDVNVNLTKVFNKTKLTPTGIICLNNDVRIGPFDHYAVWETEINLIAIEKGIFSLQGVKIIDITSGESFDCGKLLEVVVFD